MYPPTFVCPNNHVLCKTNANFLDNSGTNPKSFYGVFYTKRGTSSEFGMNGMVNPTTSQRNTEIGNYLHELSTGWHKFSPSFCIDSQNNAKIHWFSQKSGGSRITVTDAMNKYNTIIAGQHCLVHNSKPVFESTPVYSHEGATIANWRDLNNQWNHHNENIGGGNSKIARRRALLGHTKNKEFPMVVIEGDIDWGDPGSSGIDLKVASYLMADLGCDYALNMDGGSPTQFYENNIRRYGNAYTVGSIICAY